MNAQRSGTTATSTATAPSALAKPARDFRLDFFRGCALVFIFMDHIPDNVMSYLTLRSFAFADAAEVFIFISGYTAALVYGRALAREGSVLVTARILRRVWQLYLAHLFLFMMFNAEVNYTMLHFNNPLFADELRVGEYLNRPDEAFLGVVLLQFQPSLLNILPLYIALLLVFPLFLLAMSVHPLLALVPSFLLYCAVQIWGLNLPGYPEGTGWFFDPLAWQFLFVIAATLGFANAGDRSALPHGKWILPAAILIATAGIVIQGSEMLNEVFGWRHLLNIPVWVEDKTTLSPLRLASVMALAVLVARLVPRNAAFLTSRAGWLLVLCGKNSLEIFCLSILLSMLCNIVMTLAGRALIVQLAVNICGLAIMLVFGLIMAWYEAKGRLPARPVVGDAA
jgi:hypothetical protein